MGTYHHGNLRPALVEAAVALARARGPEGVVLREVARQTGVSHNAAYRHFADREELLAEVGDAAMRQLAAAMTAELAGVREQEPDALAVARLRATGRAYVHFALAEPGLFEVAFAARGDLPGDGADGPDRPGAQGPEAPDGGTDERRQQGSAVVLAGVTEDDPTSDPYALLGMVLDELVVAGAVSAQRREGAEALCWSAVHGFAVLHQHGPLRDVPPQEREHSLEALLDQIERGLR